MNLRDGLRKGIEELKLTNTETPAVDAGVILCHAIKRDRAYIYTHGEYEMSTDEIEEYMHLLRRRAMGEPVQYLTGHQEFMGLDFKVNEHVLVPRPDTEVLVETVLKYAKEHKGKGMTEKVACNILDIGTGSGCIAISLAYYLPFSEVTALDISEEALKVAQYNANYLGLKDRVQFVKSDVFSALREKPDLFQTTQFDIIVSNPPYIPVNEIEGLQVEVRKYEPMGALDGGQDGLDFYRRITRECLEFLKFGGVLAFEVGYNQSECVAAIMSKDFEEIVFVKDLSSVNRVVMGSRKEE